MQQFRTTKISIALLQILALGAIQCADAADSSSYANDRVMMSDSRSNAQGTSLKAAGVKSAAESVSTDSDSEEDSSVQSTADSQARAAGSTSSTQAQGGYSAGGTPTAGSGVNSSAHQNTGYVQSGQTAIGINETTGSSAVNSTSVAGINNPGAISSQSGAQGSVGSSMQQSLFKQAQLWHDKFQPNLAKQTLNRILLTDPNNAEALYLMSLWSSEAGDAAESARWAERLKAAHPNDPRVVSLEGINSMSNTAKEQLKLARELAASGNIPAALTTYRNIFNGDTPPKALATEYYLTQAGDPASYNAAVQSIGNYIRSNPGDTNAKIAYGKILTYRENTRREGIRVLEYYAPNSKDADSALRDALLWLSPAASDQEIYNSYISRHPEDTEVSSRFAQSYTGSMLNTAYAEQAQQQSDKAKVNFENVLKQDPNNLQALEGLGYIEQGQGNYGAAADYLSRAAELLEGGQQKAKLMYDATLARAHKAEEDGDIAMAISLCDNLISTPEMNHTGTLIYEGYLCRKAKQYDKAEELLNRVLEDEPRNTGALEALYYIYQDQKKDTSALFARMSPELQQKLKTQKGPVYVDVIPGIRKKAAAQLAQGNIYGASEVLRSAISKHPNSAWLRYDMAKLLRQSGDSAGAQAQIDYLTRSGAGGEALYAAALYQSQYMDRDTALATLSRVPSSYNPSNVRQLRQSLKLKATMNQVENYIKSGQRMAALNSLNSMKQQAQSMGTGDLGHMAYLFMMAGDPATAVNLANMVYGRGIKSGDSIDDYADIISVFNSTGNRDKAAAIMQNASIMANSDPVKISRTMNGGAIAQADKLRSAGRSADAYDVLYAALQSDPNNPDLMNAMARIYHDNEMYEEASNIYDRVLSMDPHNKDAIVGGINTALADGKSKKVDAIAARLAGVPDDPQNLLLKARVAKESKHYSRAIDYLKRAKNQLEGSPYYTSVVNSSGSVGVSGLHAYNNPFRNDNEVTQSAAEGDLMPWEKGVNDPANLSPASNASRMTAENRETLDQVNKLLKELQEKTATVWTASVESRQKDGEKGLSKVTSVRAPMSVSTPIVDGHRATFTITPDYMSAGRTNSDSNKKFGTNAVNEEGVTHNIRKNGVEFNLALEGDNYRGDIGISPVGKKGTSFVGGLMFNPKIFTNTHLTMTLERRMLKDSVLSYYGYKDRYKDKFWGAVAKNGGSLILHYDTPKFGWYTGHSVYYYDGKHVRSNHSVGFNAGFYVPVISDKRNRLTVGLDFNYMDFARNENHFSYGYGGYFSPQNYYALAFPVNYHHQFSDRFSMDIAASIGYQSYDSEGGAYYPKDSSLQKLLEAYYILGWRDEYRYSSSNESGVAGSAKVQVDYSITYALRVGGLFNYNTFGDYNETTEFVYLNYYM